MPGYHGDRLQRRCFPLSGRRQFAAVPQPFALPLDAGTYFLGIAGFGAASGRYSIHVQALELSDNGILLNASQLGTPLFIDENTNNSTAAQSESFCGLAGSKDFQVLYTTCQSFELEPVPFTPPS